MCRRQALERLTAARAIPPAPESVLTPHHRQVRADNGGLLANAPSPKDTEFGHPELRPAPPRIHVATQAHPTGNLPVRSIAPASASEDRTAVNRPGCGQLRAIRTNFAAND